MFRTLLTLLLLFLAATSWAAELEGRVTWVYDGDTIEVGDIGKVRLLGIDTPEYQDSSRDNFYLKRFHISRKKLREISRRAKRFNIIQAKGKTVRLETEKEQRDKHGRLLAYVYLADDQQLNRLLLQQGLASVFRRYGFAQKHIFLEDENKARAAQIGLWAD